MYTTIFIKNLRITGTHGAHLPTALPKEFLINIDVQVADITDAVATDDITHVFDYRDAIAMARRVIQGVSVHLIETLASRIVTAIATLPHVQKINLTLSKREVGDDFDSGITVAYEVSDQNALLP